MRDYAQYERVWAEIDLAAIRHNYRRARQLAGTAAVMPVIKADAYGHGALPVAAALVGEGAQMFGVATADEALALRGADFEGGILVMGAVPPARIAALCDADVAVCVTNLAAAQEYSEEVLGVPLRVHVKVDTGMARLGLAAAGAAGEIQRIAALPGLVIEGVFTHFAVADEAAGDAATQEQASVFIKVCEDLRAAGCEALVRHAANSAGILRHPGTYLDMVRGGIMLYGCAPSTECGDAALRPAMALRARIACVREVAEGDAVSYGSVWRADRPTRIATVCAGYADGIPRVASGRFEVLVRGRRVKQVGRVCMDMCMVDVTDVPGVEAGCTATFFGTEGPATLPVEQLAGAAGTISYEQLCAVSARVPRFYTDGQAGVL